MKCPNCDFIEKDEVFGDPATCPKCGAIYEKALRIKADRERKELYEKINKETSRSQGSVHHGLSGSATPVGVKITDIDLPFWSMVQLMVKWALASIPAVLILMLIFVGFISIFRAMFS